jgi:hydrogenase-4 component F
MMGYGLLLGILIILPCAGGAICTVLPTLRRILAAMCATVMVCALITASIVWRVFTGGPIEAFGGIFYVDALSAYHLSVMTIVFVASSIYAWHYFIREMSAGHITKRNSRQYGGLWCGALAAMTLVLISNNLGIMWVGIEATTLLTAFLICIPVRPASLEAMWKYLMICSIGVAFAFLGTLMVAASASGLHLSMSDTLLWTKLRSAAVSLNPMLLKAGFLCLLVGYGTKAGLAPMHSWLPDAHSQAPAPVSAIFSGFMLNAALYCVIRYVPIVETTTGMSGWSLQLLVLFGIVSILVAAAFIIFQHDVKRLLAYHSVEHIGIITLGLGLGGLGTFAALFHTLNHSICKTLSFFAAGRLGQTYGTHDMTRMSGSLRSAPVWGTGLFGSLLALIGVAPFAIFMSEFQVLKAAMDSRAILSLILFLAGASVVFVGALKHAVAMAWGEPSPLVEAEHAGKIEVLLVLAPLAILLLLGLWMPGPLWNILKQAAAVLEVSS